MNKITSCISDTLRSGAGLIPPKKRFNSAIVLAGGMGTRMGGGKVTKQMMRIDGIPVVVRSLLAFQNCEYVNEIIIVGREEELDYYADFSESFGLSKITAVVKGGKTRQESVFCGIQKISDKSEYLAIHDGARCLVTSEIIQRTYDEANKYGAAAAAEGMTDTVKRCDASGMVKETLDRSELWRVQTPQTFKTNIYLAAAYTADKEKYEATDDCMLAEHAGFRVKLIDCGHENIKITCPQDLIIAEAILTARKIRIQKEVGKQNKSKKR